MGDRASLSGVQRPMPVYFNDSPIRTRSRDCNAHAVDEKWMCCEQNTRPQTHLRPPQLQAGDRATAGMQAARQQAAHETDSQEPTHATTLRPALRHRANTSLTQTTCVQSILPTTVCTIYCVQNVSKRHGRGDSQAVPRR